jgi:uncharacterized membrane protein
MTTLIIGLAVFLGIHSISIATPGLRVRAIASIGSNGWRGIYSLISAVGFALILYGYHMARQAPVVLYIPPAWMRQVSLSYSLWSKRLIHLHSRPARTWQNSLAVQRIHRMTAR